MYESLKKHCKNFHLYIFAFDKKAFNILKSLDLSSATIINIKDFEDNELISIKYTRTKTEYFWTCTPSIILYTINMFKLNECTYLDADIFFFRSPKVLLNELNNKSVLITEHRYTPVYNQTKKSGKYCVQFITFKNNSDGIKTLKWWRNACIEWCYERYEDNKFGDQKYLDDWMDRFKGIHELQNLGGGIAPWNVQQYTFDKHKNNIIGTEIKSNKKFDLIFYHFHSYKEFFVLNKARIVHSTSYYIDKSIKDLIYNEYIKSIQRIRSKLSVLMPNISLKHTDKLDIKKYLYFVFIKKPTIILKYKFNNLL